MFKRFSITFVSRLIPVDADAKKKIVDGSWDVFWGPVKDQTGAVKIAAGQKMSDADMLSFNWFVEGVEGTISK